MIAQHSQRAGRPDPYVSSPPAAAAAAADGSH
jgi:hypothetical protein